MFTCQNCKKIGWLCITPSAVYILLYITMEFYNFYSKSSSLLCFPTVHDVAAALTRHTHELSKNNDETRQFSVFNLLCSSKCKNTAINANFGISWSIVFGSLHSNNAVSLIALWLHLGNSFCGITLEYYTVQTFCPWIRDEKVSFFRYIRKWFILCNLIHFTICVGDGCSSICNWTWGNCCWPFSHIILICKIIGHITTQELCVQHERRNSIRRAILFE